MRNIGKRIEDEMPIDRVKATCEFCGEVLHDTDNTKRVIDSYHVGRMIEKQVQAHRESTLHSNIAVDILKEPSIIKDVDLSVTVGEVSDD